jgi:hypothetical protein
MSPAEVTEKLGTSSNARQVVVCAPKVSHNFLDPCRQYTQSMYQAVRRLERGCLKVFSGYRRTSKNVSSRCLHHALNICHTPYALLPEWRSINTRFCFLFNTLLCSYLIWFSSHVPARFAHLRLELVYLSNTYILIPPFSSVLLLNKRSHCINTRLII